MTLKFTAQTPEFEYYNGPCEILETIPAEQTEGFGTIHLIRTENGETFNAYASEVTDIDGSDK